jgi:hypothetical protein
VRLERRVARVAARQPGVDEVAEPEEVRDERGPRLLVELLGRPALLDAPLVHHRDLVGHRHGLLLIVRDVHEREPDLARGCA